MTYEQCFAKHLVDHGVHVDFESLDLDPDKLPNGGHLPCPVCNGQRCQRP